MPYLKQTPAATTVSRENGALRNSQSVRVPDNFQTEARISNSVIADKLELKNTPLTRLTSYKTTVTYYEQAVSNRNDYISNTANINTLDVNKRAFYKISDFIILCNEALNTTINVDNNAMDLLGSFTAKVLPNSIQPLMGDYLVMSLNQKNALFRVTQVTKVSVEKDSAYEITLQLVEEETDEKLREIENLVTDKYYFVYAHVGTTFRTIFREEEYKSLEKLDKLYSTLGEIYNDYFYDDDKNTYILRYDSTEIKDESGLSIEEQRLQEKPYHAVNEQEAKAFFQNGIVNTEKPRLNNTDNWFGSLMYDRMLVKFIQNTNIFSSVKRKIFRVTQLQEDLEKWYSKTIFYAIENQTTKRLVFKYLVPSPVTRITISSNLNLYGTVSLEPIPELIGSALPLYPQKLIPYMYWSHDVTKDKSKNVELNTYNDMIELICEVIGLYVNKKEDLILDHINLMYDHMDEFLTLDTRDQNSFYLFPILAYVLIKEMDRLSDPTFGLSSFRGK